MKIIILMCLISLSVSSCTNDVAVQKKSLIDYIPLGSRVVFRINNLEKAKKTLKENSIINSTSVIDIIDYFTSLPGQDQKKPYEALLCFSAIDDECLEYTLISKLNNPLLQSNFYKKIEMENVKHEKERFFAKKHKNNVIYSMEKDSVLITSSSQKIIENIIQEEAQLTVTKSFYKAYERSSRDLSVSVLLEGKSLIETFNQLFPVYKKRNIPVFNDWINVAIDATENKVLAEADVDPDMSDNTILSLFDNISSRKSKVAEIIPFNSIGFTAFTYDHYSILKENLAKFRQQDPHVSSTLDDLLSDVLEIGFVSFEQASALVLRCGSVFHQAKKYHIKKIATYWGTDIYQFESPRAFKRVLYPLVSKIDANYYFSYKNYIVYAESIEILKMFIIHIKDKKTIKNQKWYSETVKHVSDSTSIFMFKSPQNLGHEIQQGVAEKYQKLWNNFDLHKRHTRSVSIHKDVHSGRTKIKMLLNKTNDDYITTSRVSTLGTIKLKNEIFQNPILVKNSIRQELDIIVQDVKSQLYLFSYKGDALWEKQLDGPILGKIKQISFKEKGGYMFVFNTKSSLYLLDSYGNDLPGYPRKFAKEITQPLAIYDYGKAKNYQFIVTQGSQVSSYNCKGKE